MHANRTKGKRTEKYVLVFICPQHTRERCRKHSGLTRLIQVAGETHARACATVAAVEANKRLHFYLKSTLNATTDVRFHLLSIDTSAANKYSNMRICSIMQTVCDIMRADCAVCANMIRNFLRVDNVLIYNYLSD